MTQGLQNLFPTHQELLARYEKAHDIEKVGLLQTMANYVLDYHVAPHFTELAYKANPFKVVEKLVRTASENDRHWSLEDSCPVEPNANIRQVAREIVIRRLMPKFMTTDDINGTEFEISASLLVLVKEPTNLLKVGKSDLNGAQDFVRRFARYDLAKVRNLADHPFVYACARMWDDLEDDSLGNYVQVFNYAYTLLGVNRIHNHGHSQTPEARVLIALQLADDVRAISAEAADKLLKMIAVRSKLSKPEEGIIKHQF